MEQTNTHQTEVLAFTKGDNLATICTDGARHISREYEHTVEHSTLHAAIAFLEAKGYRIDTSNFQTI